MTTPLAGKVALVAGATRGAGRAIAVELGRLGATVYATGRTTREQASELGRPETIEETAELVTAAGGRGIAVQVDHLDPVRVRALVERIDSECGQLDVLVNDVWGGDPYAEWGSPLWRHDLDKGLRLLRLGLETHIVTSHAALPLLIRRPGGIVVEVTDGTNEYNVDYRGEFFYDLAKTSVARIALAQNAELTPYGCCAVVVTPGFLRSEAMLDLFGAAEANWRNAVGPDNRHFSLSETPTYLGRGVAALVADPDASRWAGRSLSSAGLAKAYGLTDLDGTQPDFWRYAAENSLEGGGAVDDKPYR